MDAAEITVFDESLVIHEYLRNLGLARFGAGVDFWMGVDFCAPLLMRDFGSSVGQVVGDILERVGQSVEGHTVGAQFSVIKALYGIRTGQYESVLSEIDAIYSLQSRDPIVAFYQARRAKAWGPRMLKVVALAKLGEAETAEAGYLESLKIRDANYMGTDPITAKWYDLMKLEAENALAELGVQLPGQEAR